MSEPLVRRASNEAGPACVRARAYAGGVQRKARLCDRCSAIIQLNAVVMLGRGMASHKCIDVQFACRSAVLLHVCRAYR